MSSKKKKDLPSVTLIMVGSGGVGKSALANRYLFRTFTDSYTPTSADTLHRKVTVDARRECHLTILDTAGQEEYAAIRDSYYKQGDGFVVVFAIEERDSWTQVLAIRDQICRALNDDHPPLVLVGNKADLDLRRQVTLQEAEAAASKWGNCEYLEASAKDGRNVDQAFESILRRVFAIKDRQAMGASAEAAGDAASSRTVRRGGCCAIS